MTELGEPEYAYMRVTRDCALGKWAGLTLTDPL